MSEDDHPGPAAPTLDQVTARFNRLESLFDEFVPILRSLAQEQASQLPSIPLQEQEHLQELQDAVAHRTRQKKATGAKRGRPRQRSPNQPPVTAFYTTQRRQSRPSSPQRQVAPPRRQASPSPDPPVPRYEPEQIPPEESESDEDFQDVTVPYKSKHYTEYLTTILANMRGAATAKGGNTRDIHELETLLHFGPAWPYLPGKNRRAIWDRLQLLDLVSRYGWATALHLRPGQLTPFSPDIDPAVLLHAQAAGRRPFPSSAFADHPRGGSTNARGTGRGYGYRGRGPRYGNPGPRNPTSGEPPSNN